jgi:hypothetical protein
MPESRRRWLALSARALGVVAAAPFLSAQMTPRPIPSPNAPNPNFPPGLDGPPNQPDQSTRTIDPQVQKDLRASVEKLFDLAAELKQQVQKSDPTATLSISMVKTAQEIEKLAKRIKNLSRG